MTAELKDDERSTSSMSTSSRKISDVIESLDEFESYFGEGWVPNAFMQLRKKLNFCV